MENLLSFTFIYIFTKKEAQICYLFADTLIYHDRHIFKSCHKNIDKPTSSQHKSFMIPHQLSTSEYYNSWEASEGLPLSLH